MNFAVLDGTLRAERLTRYELAMDQQLGGTSVGAYTFYEGVRDQLVNAFEGAEETRALHIFNGGSLSTGGVGLTVGRCFGDSIRGSMSYAYGRSCAKRGPRSTATSPRWRPRTQFSRSRGPCRTASRAPIPRVPLPLNGACRRDTLVGA